MIRIILLITLIFTLYINGQIIVENPEWELVASNLNFPEGPAWNRNGILYFSNCYGGWIAELSYQKLDTLIKASDSTFQKTNGIVIGKNGNLFICEYGEGKIIQFSEKGEISTLLDGYNGIPFNRPNDLTFDEKGNLYFTDPKGYRAQNNEGRVFYYNFDNNELKLVADSLDFPNGIAVSPITKNLYLSESGKNRILEFEKKDSGRLFNRRTFINLKGGDPDGLDFDSSGNLYIAHFGTGHIFVVSPSGKIIQKIKTPGKKPSNIEFGGKDLKTIFITEDETNSVFKLQGKIRGFKILEHTEVIN